MLALAAKCRFSALTHGDRVVATGKARARAFVGNLSLELYFFLFASLPNIHDFGPFSRGPKCYFRGPSAYHGAYKWQIPDSNKGHIDPPSTPHRGGVLL